MRNSTKLIFILCFGFFLQGKSALNAQTTTTFNYTGGVQTYVVPSCVTQITVSVAGAQGGSGQGAYETYSATDVGGEGGNVTGVLMVTAGTTIDIFVGGTGTEGTSSSEGVGGWNGGANGFYYYYATYNQGYGGGGGGGASDIRISPYALANRVVVAGGGGGGGFNNFTNNEEQGGSGGGLTGAQGYAYGIPGIDTAGAGGTQAAGGLGGTFAGYCTASSGTLGNGGADCNSASNPGGGGGGGYYGGGGGVFAGGGGGSSYVAGLSSFTINSQGTQPGNGVVIITANSGSASLSLSTSQTNPSCINNDGSASVIVSGGSMPYTYAWAPSGGSNASDSGLSAGTYTLTVQDICGDISTTSVILIANTPTVTATTTANVLCSGGATGSASSTVSGGTTPYTYTWSNSQTTPTISSLSAGTYTLNISDNNGCSGSTTVAITQPNAISVSANATANVLCNGGTTGSASSTVSGGTTPYTYTWSNSQTTPTISSLSAGTYTLNISDNNGCSGSTTVAITQPNAISVSANATANVLCNGGTTGSASSTVSGGITPYTYTWSNSQTTPTISSLSAGTYTLNISDNNGCSSSASVSISEPTAVSVSANATANVLCSGGATGSASSTVSGGTTPYTYTWSNSQTTPTISSLSAGTYTLNVSDNNGCSGSAAIAISQPSTISIAANSAPTNIGSCTGSAWVSSVNGGTPPYTYLWEDGNTTDSISLQCSGTYCCKVTDTHGCIDSICVVITQSSGIDNIESAGSQITVYPNPNNGVFNIQWSVVSGHPDSYQESVEIYNLLGEKVYSNHQIIKSSNYQINLSNQPNGIYFYRVLQEDGSLLGEGKVVIEK